MDEPWEELRFFPTSIATVDKKFKCQDQDKEWSDRKTNQTQQYSNKWLSHATHGLCKVGASDAAWVLATSAETVNEAFQLQARNALANLVELTST